MPPLPGTRPRLPHRGFVASIDAAKVGLGLMVFARVWLMGQGAETREESRERQRGPLG
ncbi:MAG: hypothetical protein QOK38_614 [Acidobacteriaceae bacterium]|jgi:hypothetical protein|nr:hypothetical protein [Acidobacteriaceae bacterium]